MGKSKSSCYCINLRRAANTVSTLYDQFLEPVGLTVNQFSLLENLSRLGTCCVSELAAYVGLERTTLVRTLQQLIDRGLIRDTSTAGQRSRSLQLTELGEKTRKQGLPYIERAKAEMENRVGKENLSTLYTILDQLYDP